MIDAILGRRSIRSYLPGDVTEEQLRSILLAGMAAPSALGTEPWLFVVIRDRDLLRRIPEAHPYAKMVRSAAVAILVCHDERVTEGADWYVQDCAAATENILLAVSALGLGAVWLGVHPREPRVEALRELLGLEGWLRPFSLIPIGVPGENKAAKNTFNQEKVVVLG
jgi:nitroreductase